MKKTSNIIWGIILIAVGALFALEAFDITDVDLFFDGWWTLFIIVPCAVGLFTEREKTGNIFGIIVGVLLLLCCQEIISFSFLWKLLVPAVIVLIGLKMVLSGIQSGKTKEIIAKQKEQGKEQKSTFAAFSGTDLKCDGEVFDGAKLTAVFGGIECDLRKAVIENDCVITANAIFGGIDIIVPDTVNVKANTTSIFGGVSNMTSAHKDAPTIYVNGVCMFGGVDIK